MSQGYTNKGTTEGRDKVAIGESTITVRGSSTSINTTSHSWTIPGGQAEDDMMFVFATSRNSTIGSPSGTGWTSLLSVDTSSNEWIKVWWKKCAASESTVTLTSSGTICATALVLLTGQDVTTPIYDHVNARSAPTPPIMETKLDSFTMFYYLNCYLGDAIYDIGTGALADSYTKELSVEHPSGHDSQIMVVHRDSQAVGAAAPIQQSGGKQHTYSILGALVLNSAGTG